MSAALKTLAAELDAKDRELRQLSNDVARLAAQNGDLTDEIHALREENARLKEQLAAEGPNEDRAEFAEEYAREAKLEAAREERSW